MMRVAGEKKMIAGGAVEGTQPAAADVMMVMDPR